MIAHASSAQVESYIQDKIVEAKVTLQEKNKIHSLFSYGRCYVDNSRRRCSKYIAYDLHELLPLIVN